MPFIVINEEEKERQRLPDPHYGDLLKKDFQELDLTFTHNEDPLLPKDEHNKGFVIPGNKRVRPFFFMRQIEKSMADQDGAYLTEEFFLPRYIWHMKDVRLYEVEKKMDILRRLRKEFYRVEILIENNRQTRVTTLLITFI